VNKQTACEIMFESAEEVQRAMMDLKMFGGLEEEGECAEEVEEEFKTQIFPEHEAMSERFCRTLYYGKLPTEGDRPSLPFTQVAVDQFTGVGLDALGQKLGRLSMSRAADMTKQACAGPNSLVVALLYLERLRKRNPDYLSTVSSADLFLVSLLVASKFLHDDGEEDEVFNDDWAASGGIDTKELNKLEMQFLCALDWRIYVDDKEFETAVEKIETSIAVQAVCTRGWSSYSDLSVLSRLNSPYLGSSLLSLLLRSSLQVTSVCLTAYAASLLTLLSTVALLSKTPLGPAAVSQSLATLVSSPAAAPAPASVPDYLTLEESLEETLPGLATENSTESQAEPSNTGLSPAALLKASLFVTTLASSLGAREEAARRRKTSGSSYTQPGQELDEARINLTRAEWLAEDSKPELGDNYARLDGPEGWLEDRYQFIHHSTARAAFHRGSGARDSLTGGTPSSGEEGVPGQAAWKRYRDLAQLLGRCPVLSLGYSVPWAHGVKLFQDGLNSIKVQ